MSNFSYGKQIKISNYMRKKNGVICLLLVHLNFKKDKKNNAADSSDEELTKSNQ